MLMLQKLTDATEIFVAEICNESAKVVVCAGGAVGTYGVGLELSLQSLSLDSAISERKTIDAIKSHSYYTSPIVLSNHCVWGVMVLLLPESVHDAAAISLPVSTFNRVLCDQIELSMFEDKRNSTAMCNMDRFTAGYMRGSSMGVPWCLDVNSEEFTYIGEQSLQIISYTDQDWKCLGDWVQAVHPEDRERVKDYYLHMKDADKDHVVEYRLVKKDGSIIWIRDVMKGTLCEDSGNRELMGFMVDISWAKEKEQGLTFINNQLRKVLTVTNTVLVINNEDGDVVFHSHKDASMVPKKCYHYLRGALKRCGECPLSGPVKRESIFYYRDKDRTVQVSAFPYEVEPEKWFVAEMHVNISDRISKENETALLKDRLELSMKSGSIAYLEFNLATKILKTNTIFEEITGLNLNNKIVDLEWVMSRVHEKDYEYVKDVYDFALNSRDKKLSIEFRFLNVDNKYVWLRFSGQVLIDEHGGIDIAGILIDISDTKELMNALMLERNKSLQASEAKSMFLANMSHEIRTPMNAIIGFSELLSKHIVKAPLNGYLNSIKASGKVLLALINDLLDLEKIEAGKMIIRKENTDFIGLLKEIEQTFSMNFAEKQIELLMKPQAKFPKLIYVDSLKIKQILLNLVNNALKFTNKGEVEVQSFFKFDSGGEKGTLSFKVSDTGIGIAKNKQESIFEPFVQDKDPNEKDHQGTGLGLSIVQKLVRMMGGVISLESEAGVGSTFSIMIPDVEATDDPFSEMEGEIESNVKFNQEKVLIVDNVETNLEVLNAMCSNLNLKSITCTHGKEVLELALVEKPAVIIMDLRVPKHNGFKSIKDIRQSELVKDIPVIAISSSSNVNEEKLADNEGFDGFISKPIPVYKLIQEISRFVKPVDEEEVSSQLEREDAATKLSDGDKKVINLAFKETILPLWQSLKDILSSEKLNTMLSVLKELSGQVSWPALDRYTEKMDIAIKSFDFETIQKLINRFDSLLKELE